MKKNYFLSILIMCLCVTLVGCGKKDKKEDKNKSVLSSEYIDVDGIYVDKSKEEDGLDVLYVFYTVKAKDTNMDLSSSGMEVKINDKNKYSATVSQDYIPKYTNYYYSSFIEYIYIGDTLKMCSTFKIPSGDLTDSKKVELINFDIPSIGNIKFTTDDIKFMDNYVKIAEDVDVKIYQTKQQEEERIFAKVDTATESKVKGLLNGYYFSFPVSLGTTISTHRLDFISPNKFTLKGAFGITNSGTYEVRQGVLILTYQTGISIDVYYELKNGEIYLNRLDETFGTNIDYNPMEEE